MAITHKALSEWYHQTAQLLQAGLSLPDAVDAAQALPARVLQPISAQLRAGTAIDTVLGGVPGWLPQADRLLLSAGAETGRIPEVMESLSREHAFMHRVRGNALAASIYPLVILNLAALAWPATALFEIGPDLQAPDVSIADYATAAGQALLFLWGCIGLLWLVARGRPQLVRSALGLIPGLAQFARCHAIARFCAGFGGFLRAGIDYRRALGGAAVICEHERLRDAALDLLAHVEAGAPPLEVMRADKRFPADLVQTCAGAELTGQLPESLERLAANYRERADNALRAAAFWYPKLLFALVAGLIAWQVLSAYRGYLDEILKLL